VLEFDFEPELPGWSKKLVGFDLETTGLNLATARIVTASVVEIDAAADPLFKADWLVNPGVDIPAEASAVHGVTNEIAQRDGVSPVSALTELSELLSRHFAEGTPVVAFNAPYDFTILRNELIRHGLPPLSVKPVIDPLVMDKQFVKFRKGKRTLSILCGHYSIELLNAHESSADALAAVRLAQHQARIFAKDMEPDAFKLHDLQIDWSKAQDENFANFMSTKNPEFKINPGWPEKP